ncbi:MAG: acyl-CoA dehydrogenase [Alphaproteobacteria bacterium]|nr:acyl-CoA dehydrogenase [Alphaproteobacteria bacterium]
MATLAKQTRYQPIGTPDELIARARALVPVLRGRAEACEEIRSVPAETMRDFAMAGCHRILQPTRYGGAEAPLATIVDIQSAMTSGCGSSGWVHGQNVIHNFMVAAWPEAAQDDVWGAKPEAFLSGILIAGLGRARKVQGGWRLSGRWPFVSGVSVCDWCLFSAYAEGGAPGAEPETWQFILPQGSFEIIDTWRAIGLRGTCSHDAKVDDVFVPDHRALPLEGSRGGESPGTKVNRAAIYRAPSYALFSIVQGSSSLGMAQSVFDAYLAQAQKRASLVSGKSVADYGNTHLKLGEAAASLDGARTILVNAANLAQAIAEAGRVPTMVERTRWRRDGAFAGRLCMRAAERVLELAGGSGIYDTNPISRGYRDLRSANTHISQNWDINASNWGRAALGLAVPDNSL